MECSLLSSNIHAQKATPCLWNVVYYLQIYMHKKLHHVYGITGYYLQINIHMMVGRLTKLLAVVLSIAGVVLVYVPLRFSWNRYLSALSLLSVFVCLRLL